MSARTSRGFAVLVAGVPGVGKTTLLKDHVTNGEARDQAVVGSSVMNEVLAPKTVHDMAGMTDAEQAGVRTQAIRRLSETKRAAVGRLLVDGHFTLRNQNTGALDTTFTEAEAKFYDGLVVVEAPADLVVTWRAGDQRDRGRESASTISQHLVAERAEAVRLAGATGLPLLIIGSVSRADRLLALGKFLRLHAALEAT